MAVYLSRMATPIGRGVLVKDRVRHTISSAVSLYSNGSISLYLYHPQAAVRVRQWQHRQTVDLNKRETARIGMRWPEEVKDRQPWHLIMSLIFKYLDQDWNGDDAVGWI